MLQAKSSLTELKKADDAMKEATSIQQAERFCGRTLLFALQFERKELMKKYEALDDSQDKELTLISQAISSVMEDYCLYLTRFLQGLPASSVPTNFKTLILIAVGIAAVSMYFLLK